MKFCLFQKNNIDLTNVEKHLSTFGECIIYDASLNEDAFKDVDIFVSVGGDGTLLRCAKYTLKYSKPIVGINAGHLGYLCAFKIDELSTLTKKDFENLKVSERTLLEYEGHYAVNDVCVLKSNPSQSITVDVKNVATWKGDGVIFATATGSSAYNQSAGGPILNPTSSDIVVTPICPHFSKVGPQVFKDVDSFEVEMTSKTKGLISCDADLIGPIDKKVIIKKSKQTLKLMQR